MGYFYVLRNYCIFSAKFTGNVSFFSLGGGGGVKRHWCVWSPFRRSVVGVGFRPGACVCMGESGFCSGVRGGGGGVCHMESYVAAHVRTF